MWQLCTDGCWYCCWVCTVMPRFLRWNCSATLFLSHCFLGGMQIINFTHNLPRSVTLIFSFIKLYSIFCVAELLTKGHNTSSEDSQQKFVTTPFNSSLTRESWPLKGRGWTVYAEQRLATYFVATVILSILWNCCFIQSGGYFRVGHMFYCFGFSITVSHNTCLTNSLLAQINAIIA